MENVNVYKLKSNLKELMILVNKIKFTGKFDNELSPIIDELHKLSSLLLMETASEEKYNFENMIDKLNDIINRLFDFSNQVSDSKNREGNIIGISTRGNAILPSAIISYLMSNVYIISGSNVKTLGIVVTKKMVLEELEKIKSSLISKFIYSEMSYEDIINEAVKNYDGKTINIEHSDKYNLEIYYGSLNFMLKKLEIAKTELQYLSDNKICEKNDELIDFIILIENLTNKFNNLEFTSLSLIEQKKAYLSTEKIYKNFLRLEKKLSIELENIWKQVLTHPSEYDSNNFAFIGHIFTEEACKVKDMKKVCCSYFTNDTLPIISRDYNCDLYGYLFDYDEQFVDSISYTDAGSWLISKEEFLFGSVTDQFTKNISDTESIYYEEDPTICKIILPNRLSEFARKKSMLHNGELLSNIGYNEIVLINKEKKLKPIGVFVLSNDLYDNSRVEKKAKKLSEKLNLPLVKINESLLRSQLGLDPNDVKLSYAPGLDEFLDEEKQFEDMSKFRELFEKVKSKVRYKQK